MYSCKTWSRFGAAAECVPLLCAVCGCWSIDAGSNNNNNITIIGDHGTTNPHYISSTVTSLSQQHIAFRDATSDRGGH